MGASSLRSCLEAAAVVAWTTTVCLLVVGRPHPSVLIVSAAVAATFTMLAALRAWLPDNAAHDAYRDGFRDGQEFDGPLSVVPSQRH